MRVLLLFVLPTLLASVTLAQVKYSTYENKRFGYSIEYPETLLVMQPPPTNGDGRIFLSRGKDVEMRVWGEHNALFHSIQEEFDTALRSYGESVSYTRKTASGFVISGIRDGRIYYQRTIYHKFKKTDVFSTFTIEYPLEQRGPYDRIVQKISRSFRFDSNADV